MKGAKKRDCWDCNFLTADRHLFWGGHYECLKGYWEGQKDSTYRPKTCRENNPPKVKIKKECKHRVKRVFCVKCGEEIK